MDNGSNVGNLEFKQKFAVCFKRGMLCFTLKGSSKQSRRYWSVFHPAIKWALFFALWTFGEILSNVFTLQTVSVQRVDLVSFIRILKPKIFNGGGKNVFVGCSEK